MKTAEILASCLLVFSFAGTAPKSVPKLRAKPLNTPEELAARRAPLQAQLRRGAELFRSGRYGDAARQFDEVRNAAQAAHVNDVAFRALGNMGGCLFAIHQYQPALRSFLEAQQLAKSAGDRNATAALDVNIASLYSEMGEFEAAAQWTRGALEGLSATERREQEPKLLIQMATLRARQDHMPEALRMFSQGIAAADRSGDLELSAIGWNRLGEEFLKRGELTKAEPALLESYRLRRLNHFALDSSYRSVGRLRLEQGDLDSASALLDRAVELAARPGGPIPSWDVYHYRGRVRLAQGRLQDALDDLRIARRLARAWRWSIPAGDATRIGAEGWLQMVHSALVEAGNRLYLRTGDPALIRETFEAAEENRANSLRAPFSSPRTADGSNMPPGYWEAIARLQHAEVEALRMAAGAAETSAADTGAAAGAEDALSAARAELIRLEASRGLAASQGPAASPGAISTPLPTNLLAQAEAALDADSAVFSFELSDSISWLWALDREGLALYTLPPRKEIELQVQAAALAIRQDSPDVTRASAALYDTLFGPLGERFRRKTRWLLALDQGMFDAPVAALTDTTGPAPSYVAEHHITQFIPGVGYWLESRARAASETSEGSPWLLGVGDPIYSAADPRLRRVRKRAGWAWPLHLFAKPKLDGELTLPRLVASSTELDACANAWNGGHTLLKGSDASRYRLLQELRRNPSVIHLATHVLQSTSRSGAGLIALSLKNDGEMELLPALEIARWNTHAGLVVLSGCHSAQGADLPGTGLVGLTRAWLMAGARSVVSSNWDTPDESGRLFSSLYSNMSGQRAGPAAALRAAQLDMIRAGGWRARPRYWGAYTVVGSE